MPRKDFARFQLFYCSPSVFHSSDTFVSYERQKLQVPARNAGVIMAITMQLENVRLTIDDVAAHLVRTGNFAILLPDSREKYNKTPRFSQRTGVKRAEKRSCVRPRTDPQFLLIFRATELSRVTKDSRTT